MDNVPSFLNNSTLEILHPNFPISLRRSSTYFLWEIKIPCLEYATSIQRKYFSFPNSFISNCVANFSFRFSISISSSLVSMKEGIFNIKLYQVPAKFDVAKSNNRNMISISNNNGFPFGYFKSNDMSQDAYLLSLGGLDGGPFLVTIVDPVLEFPLSSMTDRR
ncbi:hypothetical protein CR513_08047, partial [Mucuna pruriens]